MSLRGRYTWGFLALIGVILLVAGLMGRPGSLLAVAFAPDQITVAPGAS